MLAGSVVSSDRRPVAAPTRARQLYSAGRVGAVASTALLALCLGTGLGGARLERTVADLALSIVALLAAAACGRRCRQADRRLRWSWGLLAAAVLCWGLGQLVATYESVPGRAVPLPSLADVGYLGMPVLTAAGLLAVPLASQGITQLARSVLDGLMIAASLLLISWIVLLGPLLEEGAASRLAMTVSLAYPVTDVVVVTLVLCVFARGRQLQATPLPLVPIGCGLVTFAISDSGFAYLTMAGRHRSGAVLDLGWFVGFVLILLAALRPATGEAAGAGAAPITRLLGVLLPYAAVLAAVITSMLELVRSPGRVGYFVPWNRNVLLLLIVGRQLLTLLENRALTRHLERRVELRTAELRASERRFEALVQHSSDVVTVVDEAGTVIYQSESMRRVFGHPAQSLVNRPLTELLDEAAADRLHETLRSVAGKPYGSLTVELPIRRADGRICQAELTVTNLLADPNVEALVLNTRDITDRKELESQLVHEAFHDSLTNLANRALFTDRVEQALRRRDRDEHPIAVLFLDLDGFKEVNDSRGHAVGDKLLTEVADRLRASVRPQDTVARFGGDEFAILLENGNTDAEPVAGRVLEQVGAPVLVDGDELHVSASIGIAFGGPEAENAGQLLRNADLAMYRAKAAGAGQFALYHPEMHTALVDRLQLAADLRRGLDEDEFFLHYLPIIDLASGVITGFEALARWRHPSRGLIPPAEFIPLAESTGLIRRLGTYLLREACRQVMEWAPDERRPLAISVNVSARQLEQPEFLDLVAAALADSGLPAHRLCLEMTESVLMADTERVLVILEGLKAMGVQLAIDDFGTGYSSLSYLHRFPFDVLKIDKSFVDRLAGPSGEVTLARTIVQLGHGLGVTTIAEGLEHFEQLLALRRIGCEVGQGFYFSRPVPAEQAGRLLAAEPSNPGARPKNAGARPKPLRARRPA